MLAEVSHGEAEVIGLGDPESLVDNYRNEYASRSTSTLITVQAWRRPKAGIDTFAVAVGYLHGRYPIPKRLDLELLARIRDAIPVTISLHGGSGTPGHYFERAAQVRPPESRDVSSGAAGDLDARLRALPGNTGCTACADILGANVERDLTCDARR